MFSPNSPNNDDKSRTPGRKFFGFLGLGTLWLVPFAGLMFLMARTWFQRMVLDQVHSPTPFDSTLFWPLLIATVVLAFAAPLFFGGAFLTGLTGRRGMLGSLFAGLTGRRRILEEGMRTEAEIVRVDDTGTTVNGHPLARLTLKVNPSGGSPFEATVTQVIPRLKVPRLVPGATLPVAYIPGTDEVAIDNDAW